MCQANEEQEINSALNQKAGEAGQKCLTPSAKEFYRREGAFQAEKLVRAKACKHLAMPGTLLNILYVVSHLTHLTNP